MDTKTDIKFILINSKVTPTIKCKKIIDLKGYKNYKQLANKTNLKEYLCKKIFKESTKTIKYTEYLEIMEAMGISDFFASVGLGFKNNDLLNLKVLGKQIEFLRKEEKLSAKELANEILSVNPNSQIKDLRKVSNLEKGSYKNLSAEAVLDISKTFNFDDIDFSDPYLYVRKAIAYSDKTIEELAKSSKDNIAASTFYYFYTGQNISFTKYMEIVKVLKMNAKDIHKSLNIPKAIDLNLKSIGMYIRELRTIKFIRIDDIVSKTNISRTYYKRLEKGQANISVKSLNQLMIELSTMPLGK